jgi:hypothetical protein
MQGIQAANIAVSAKPNPPLTQYAKNQCFFALALCSAAVQEIKSVNVLAFRAMSDVFSSLLAR